MGRIEALSGGDGKAVLFVSHNLDAIQRLCTRAIVLDAGTVRFDGPVSMATEEYVGLTKHAGALPMLERRDRWGTQQVRICGFRIENRDGLEQPVLASGGDYVFWISCRKEEECPLTSKLNIGIEIKGASGTTIMLVYSRFSNDSFDLFQTETTVGCLIRDFNLAAGTYSVTLYLGGGDSETFDCLHNAAQITVAGGDYFGTGSSGLPETCRTLTRATWMAA